jgi:hypothetical protein
VTVEQWAQQIIEKELNRPVVVHDDGSQASMYDLRIGAVEAPEVAIECVGAVDPDRTETWNVGPGKGPLQLALKGDWLITVARDARISELRQRIESVLRDLEERDVRRVSTVYPSRRNHGRLDRELGSLGIRNVSRVRMPGSGKGHWTMEGTGGFVDTAGSALPGWIVQELPDPKREDVLFKLGRTSAQERWVFVPVASGGAPWSVESYLTDQFEYLPQRDRTCRLPSRGYGSLPRSARTASVGTVLGGTCLG